MHFWYKFLTYLFYFVSPIYLLIRKLNKKEHPIRYKEKLSKINLARGNGLLIWFHAASIGECMSILPLIELLQKEEKIKKILITSITLSSAEILQKKFNQNEKVVHQFFPLDTPQCVSKFLKHWSPNLCIFVDSEIWPNLIFSIKNMSIPLLLVNGRITKKTFLRWRFLKKFSEEIFKKFDLCIAANNESENYLKTLGCKNTKNYGNLKFSAGKYIDNKSDEVLLKKIENRKLWCASSTHPTEETFCGKTHLYLKSTYKNILTIIIPRHVSRIEKIKKELTNLKLKIILFSNLDQMNNDTDVLLVDAYGEALKFYNISSCVFLGKSLIKKQIDNSGQNPIEPTKLGCKIFHGPNVTNFKDIYEYLGAKGITNKVSSFEELGNFLINELKENKDSSKIVEEINNYGQDILFNVANDIKEYVNL